MVGCSAVLASVKVRNLKANHNYTDELIYDIRAVLASVKVRNLKANHNSLLNSSRETTAVLASVKVRNLKANHNQQSILRSIFAAVLASMKVRNLKANHNRSACGSEERWMCLPLAVPSATAARPHQRSSTCGSCPESAALPAHRSCEAGGH